MKIIKELKEIRRECKKHDLCEYCRHFQVIGCKFPNASEWTNSMIRKMARNKEADAIASIDTID